MRNDDFFRTLCENMQIGIVVCDRNGILIYVNPAYANFLKVDVSKFIGRHVTELVSNSRMHLVAQSGKAELNWPHEFKGDSTLVHRTPIMRNGKIEMVLGLVLFTKPENLNKIMEKLSVLQSKLKLYEDEIVSLRSTRYTLDNVIGISRGIELVKQEAEKAVRNQLPVLITGESGTGKEMIAQAIHDGSARRLYPFVRVNCAAIPKELFEAELFGYEKGSFTGADIKGKIGKFELAHMGTIFLDEIGDLPLELQPKLLRVLELKEFERVGGNKVVQSDFRLIAATNRDLGKMVKEERFRLDLYYRLNVVPINIPPLRERREDILPLVHHFIEQRKGLVSRKFDKISISSAASALLHNYDWPGNSRELLNVIERTLAALEGDTIQVLDLPLYIQEAEEKEDSLFDHSTSLKYYLQNAEKRVIRKALKQYHGNRNLTAKNLGIHRTLLYKKMKALGISYP